MKTRNRPKEVVRSAQIRAGYDRETERMCGIMGIPESTFRLRLHDMSTAKVSELRRMDKVLKFSNEELATLVRGE